MQLTDYEMQSINKFEKSIFEGQWSNDGLVSIMKLCETYLNLKRISHYAQNNNITPQGARKFRKTIDVCGYTLIADNN
jgi:GH15 family glucan-1,4-alpha-glucosidase